MTTTLPDSHAGDTLAFAVDADRCIGCVACLNAFPRLFRMDGNKAVATEPSAAGDTPTSRVLQCCPVDAIRLVTPRPEAAATAAVSLDSVPGWEAEWEKHRDDPEDNAERERRYGRLYHTSKLGDCYLLRIELPRRLPNGHVLYMYGVAQHRPEYACSAQPVGPETWSVRTRLLDPKLRHLSGGLNSFPLGFKVDYRFPEPIETAFLRLDLDDLHLYAFPQAGADLLPRLAKAIRLQLADS